MREWKPNARQEDFIGVPDNVFEAMYGGAAFGGKTEILLLLPVCKGWYKQRGWKGGMFRRTYPELEKEVIIRSHEYLPSTGAVYNGQKRMWHWPQYNSYFQFCYAELEQDVRKYDSTEWQYLAIDELTSFTEFQYMYLAFSRVRSTVPGIPAVVRSGTNPGNVGHGWVRKRFVEPARDGYTILQEQREGQYIKRIFIPAKATDNVVGMKNDPGYVARMDMLPEAERRAKKDGDWWTFSGQVFSDWRVEPFPDEPANARHIVEPYPIPQYWPKVLGIDWGYRAMTWAGWAACKPDGGIVLYKEYAAKEKKISQWASEIAACSTGEQLADVVIDPSAYGNRGDEYTIAQQFQNYSGLSPRPADNDRLSGKMLVQDLLRWRPVEELREGYSEVVAQKLLIQRGFVAYDNYKRAFEPDKGVPLPRLTVFNTCKSFIETIPLCVYNNTGKGDPEDVAEFNGDDPYDGARYVFKAAMRYLEMNRGKAHKEFQIAKVYEEFEKTKDWNKLHRKLEHVESTNYNERRGFSSRRFGRRYFR